MEKMDYRTEINRITAIFGMKSEVAAIAMNISAPTFRKKNSISAKKHSFNQKNHNDLIAYIKENADELRLDK